MNTMNLSKTLISLAREWNQCLTHAQIGQKNQHLHGVVTASDVFLVDEDAGDGFLPRHLMQQVLVVGSVL